MKKGFVKYSMSKYRKSVGFVYFTSLVIKEIIKFGKIITYLSIFLYTHIDMYI